jgi:carboxymethylenebutenolidase
MHTTTSDSNFLALPEGDGPFPAIVVAHDADHVTEHVASLCKRLASAGYVALARRLHHDGATNDDVACAIATALADVRAEAKVVHERVGIIGFGGGGFVAFLAACRTNVATAVSFYGEGIVRRAPGSRLEPLLGDVKRTTVPILCVFGTEDTRITAADVGALRAGLATRSKQHEIVVYSGAGHAFFADDAPSFRAEPARDAWARTLEWLEKRLGPRAAIGDRFRARVHRFVPPTSRETPRVSQHHQLLVSGAALSVMRAR